MKPRNILTNLEDTLMAMAAIEDRHGSSWLKQQRRMLDLVKSQGVDLSTLRDAAPEGLNREVAYTIGQAVIQCEACREKPDNWRQSSWDEMKEGIACIIYGAGGWNRWGVQYTGEILFSKFHSRSSFVADSDGTEADDTTRAREAGFKIF